MRTICIELGRLTQGFRSTAGTNTCVILDHNEIANIPKHKTVTYAQIVVDYRSQKEDPNRVRITVGGNLISYPHELTTRTADLTTFKTLANSTISMPGAQFAAADAGNFYLNTPLDNPEYMRIPTSLMPPEFVATYGLLHKVKIDMSISKFKPGCVDYLSQ